MKYLTIIFIAALLIFTACGSDDVPQLDPNMPLNEQVDVLISQNDYEAALALLDGEDRDDPEVQILLEKTHLNYGLYSMNTFDATEMRTRMNNALTQFTEVLRINPQNSVAREQIVQIMDIYATIPDRSADEDVIEGLREVGFDY